MTNGDDQQQALERTAVLVRGLARAEAFPHPVQNIEVIETHISWVILTGEFAYKIKKPLTLPFLDFSTLARRAQDCRAELRLNRRFAPQLYLDVVAIGGTGETPVIGGQPVLEYAVRMRQFAADARLDQQLAGGSLTVADLRELGAYLAASHDNAAIAPRGSPHGAAEAIIAPAFDNFRDLGRLTGDETTDALARLKHWTEAAGARLRPVFAQRRDQGRVRECHGDLHLANLVRLADGVVAFDCLEFDPELRWIDVISDISFLLMDLLHRRRPDLGYAFLNRYLEATGDYAGVEVLPFYVVYRCLVRAKVSAITREQHGTVAAGDTVRAYLDLALTFTEPPAEPMLIVMHGLSGSGKTHVSEQLLAALPAIRLRSDVLRKQRAGLAALARSASPPGGGLYTEEASRATYETLRTHATTSLRAGFDTIVDAACLQQWQRRLFFELAESLSCRCVILACEADQPTLRHRLIARKAAQTDASEADATVLGIQLQNHDPLTGAERRHVIDIDTARPLMIEALASAIEDLRRS